MPITNPYYLNNKALEKRTVTAAGNISKCRLVSYAGSQLSSAGALAFGIANGDATLGKQVSITTEGSEVAEAGGAIAVGAAVTSDASGRVIVAATGHQIFGRALTASSATGQYVEVYVTREGVSA